MAEFPALPLFTDAYLGDTTHLTTIEHGAYLLLLMVAWRSRGCALPDDDRLLARYAKCTASQWRRLRPIVQPFFDVENGAWKQRRLTDEFNHVRQVRESQRANGLASALKRKGRHATTAQPSVNQASTPSPSPTPHKSSVGKPTSQRGCRISENWTPSELPENVAALVEVWPPGRIERELDGFRDYWRSRSRDAARIDWDKTWHNRIRDQHDRIMRSAGNGRTNGMGRYQPDDGLSATTRAALHVFGPIEPGESG